MEHVTVASACPVCGPVTLLIADIELFDRGDPRNSFCIWHCPTCTATITHDVSGTIDLALRIAGVRIHQPPLELDEIPDVRAAALPIADLDLIAFHLDLQEDDDIVERASTSDGA